MQPEKKRGSKPFNPFYFLLLIVGTLFAITAFAYGMMAVRLGRSQAPPTSDKGAQLIRFLDEYGTELMAGELVVLAILTAGAIGTDEYWSRRAEKRAPAAAPDVSGQPAASPKENT